MALNEVSKILSKKGVSVSVYSGHFSTGRSHSNYFIDITAQKSKLSQAGEVARTLAAEYKGSALIDTIVCIDDTQVIATCLAQELIKPDYASINANGQIDILTPEQTSASLLLFRDNTAPMIRNKRVLVLAASVVTGYTIKSAIDAITYYGGQVAGAACIFTTINECNGVPITSIFNTADLPDYKTSSTLECTLCKTGHKIDALVNNYGFSEL